MPSIIYEGLKSFIKRGGCKNYPEKLSIAKWGEHVPLSISRYHGMSTISPFKEK